MLLDLEMLEQVKQVLAPIESEITLAWYPLVADSNLSSHSSSHSSLPTQEFQELLGFLKQIASIHPQIKIQELKETATVPRFTLLKNSKSTGLFFTGIPGGHEFSSFVLALLNVDQKGKFPDLAIQSRIKRIRGPLDLKTYISLSCENCPEVVQALNLMTLIRGQGTHEMIDGAFAQDEIKALHIQGVPSVIFKREMIHTGKSHLLELIEKFEKKFGTESSSQEVIEQNLGHYDCVVVGGGPAGTSAAIYTVRKGLKTALIAEKIGGQVQETKGIENLISVIYTEGPQLAGQLGNHLRHYPVSVFEFRRVKEIKPGKPHQLILESGETLTAEAVIVATGAKWRELKIPGEKEYLGQGVAFCPHCDGPFYQGKKIAVVGGGNSGVEAAIDLAGIVSHVTVVEYNPSLKADQILVDKLKSLPNVSVLTHAQTKQIIGDGSRVQALEYLDRETQEIKSLELNGVFIQIGLLPHSQFLKGTVELTPFGEIVIDSKNRTSQPGIYAAGDVTTVPYKQIIISMGEGAKAALACFEDRMKK